MEIVAAQDGVISIGGALAAGLTWSEIRWALSSGRWQRPMHDVIVTQSGRLTYPQRLWCVIESIGRPVYLAGTTAATLGGLAGFSPEWVDVLVPASRRPSPRPGVRIRRSRILAEADVHPVLVPPRTRVERSVIDMASWATSDRQAEAVVAAAVQQGLTTAPMLRAALARAGRRHRSGLLLQTLDDVEGGAHSTAEIAYRRLERRFGLPVAQFQAPVVLDGRRRYLDVWYERWGVAVEIDGAHHREARQWEDDLARQNAILLDGRRLLRFPARVVREQPEVVAAKVAQELRRQGWPGPESRRR
jgi:very-short-patch-repair endonuclease